MSIGFQNLAVDNTYYTSLDGVSDVTWTPGVFVNTPPTSTGGSAIGRIDTVKTFAATDFQFSDVDLGQTLQAIKVTSPPNHGTLSVGVGIEIPVADIGTLTYTPDTGYTGDDSFNFQVSDGTDYSTADAIMAITVTTDIFVLNGSFEITTPGSNTWSDGNWMYIPLPWTANMNGYGRIRYSGAGISACPGGGTWIANMTDAAYDVLTQNLQTTVYAGDTLSVTFYLLRDAIGTQGGILQASFLVGATEYSQDFDTTEKPLNTWEPYTLTQTITNTGNLSLRFKNVSGRAGWLDNVSNVTYTPFSGTRSITATGALAAVDTTYGTASATPTSFTVSGTEMAEGITVTPPAGFEVSQAAGGGSGYAGSGTAITVGTGGTITDTTVYVRLAATATVGLSPYSGDIICTSSGATPVNVATASSTVSPAALTITANDQDKFYGTTQSTPVYNSSAFTPTGLQNGETIGTVTLTYGPGALEATDPEGSTSTITPSDPAGGSFDPGNYTIGYVDGTLTVVADPVITLDGTLGAVDTTYGTASAAPTSFTLYGFYLVPASGNLTVTPPAGYEVSSGAGYSSTSLSVAYTGGTLSTVVYVRLAATAGVGDSPYSGDITVAGGEASSQTIATTPSTVSPANLTLTANNQDKPYGTTQTTPEYRLDGVHVHRLAEWRDGRHGDVDLRNRRIE